MLVGAFCASAASAATSSALKSASLDYITSRSPGGGPVPAARPDASWWRADSARSAGGTVAGGPRSDERPGVLAAIQRMRFFRPVLPGDRLELRVRLVKTFGGVHQVQAEARVGGETAAAGELLLAS